MITRILHATIVVAMITAAFFGITPRAIAAGVHDLREPAPAVRVHWVLANGKVLTEPSSSVRARWIWNDDQAEAPKLEKGGPALRIEVNATPIPSGWQLIRASGDDGEVVSISEPTPQGAHSSANQRTANTRSTTAGIRHLVFDQLATVSGYDLEFDAGQGRRERLSVAISTEPSTPALLTRPRSCPNHNLKFNLYSGTGHHLFIGLYCYEDYWNTYFYMVRSRDSTWAYTGMPPENQPRALMTKIESAAEHADYNGEPVRPRTRDLDSVLTEAVVHYEQNP